MIQAKSNAKNTRQLLQNKPKKYFTFLTRNRLYVQCFRIMGTGIASGDKYLIHNKWKNSKNQPPSHSFVYRCFTKLNQKRPLVHFVLFH